MGQPPISQSEFDATLAAYESTHAAWLASYDKFIAAQSATETAANTYGDALAAQVAAAAELQVIHEAHLTASAAWKATHQRVRDAVAHTDTKPTRLDAFLRRRTVA